MQHGLVLCHTPDKGMDEMKELTIKCVDAFTNRSFSGNPAGIVMGADSLSTEVMQFIAAQMYLNIIECGFGMQSKERDALCRVRYFTPRRELGCSGHVTIAACYSMIEDGSIPLSDGVTNVVFDTGMGNVMIDIHASQGSGGSTDIKGLERIMMHQPVQQYREADIPVDEIAEVLGIPRSEITMTGLPVVRASADIDWLIIPVEHGDTIANLQPDLIKLGMFNKKYDTFTNHIFTLDTFDEQNISYARHFGPAMGIWEDPASAMASGGLGEYLMKYGVTKSGSMTMEQGSDTDRLARIFVEVTQGKNGANTVKIGGTAATSIVRKMRIDGNTAEIVDETVPTV
jgi:trans-2,3-dihydro-3-hydroxyanthranilate isomerase